MSMGKIRQLPLHEAHKIAAGEVVERPANVVKELVENAIDAGATAISLDIANSGQTLIRIIDNGCGMHHDDALLCFQPHATSKITSVDQLHSLTTFGFRGEALTSIAAVSKVTLITREHTTAHGIELSYIDGHAHNVRDIGCPPGTDIRIENLFYNVPARKKFLKSGQTEWRHITLLFQAFCFAYPHIHFKLIHNNELVHNCPPVANLIDRTHQMWESNLSSGMINLHKSISGTAQLSGIISDSQHYRYDRSNIFLFVNNRWVKNPHIIKALLKGYLRVLPPDRFPAAIIALTIDTHEVDINIHPRKEEVQFLHPRIVENLIRESVTKTLEERHTQLFVKSSGDKTSFKELAYTPSTQPYNTQPSIERPFSQVNLHKETFFQPLASMNQLTEATSLEKHTVMHEHAQKNSEIDHQETIEIHTQFLDQEMPFHIVGTLFNTYIIVQLEQEAIIIDQHAAHERVLYERFKKQAGPAETIQLLFPQIISINSHESTLIPNITQLLARHGIIVDQINKDHLIIQSMPTYLKNVSLQEIIKETFSLIDEHNQSDQKNPIEKINEALYAMMACKAAVKAGDTLTPQQAEQLIRDLYKTENRIACPHGRPTQWVISKYELEKKFKRKI